MTEYPSFMDSKMISEMEESFTPSNYSYDGVDFIGVCLACPEKYTIEVAGNVVGQVTLRNGLLILFVGLEVRILAEFDDQRKGVFTFEERPKWLSHVAKEVKKILA